MKTSDPIPDQFVDVRTGQITAAALVRDGRFYREFELRKDGEPDRRSKGQLCQIRVSTRGWFIGRHAPVIPDREAMTEPLRRRIAELRQQADALEKDLCGMYALPEEP